MDVLVACAVICVVLWWIRHNQLYMAGQVKNPFFSFGSPGQTRRVKARYRPVSRARKVANPQQQKEVGQAVSKITTYTHDYDISVRLLSATKQKHPDRPMVWCADKVIEDIVRDRR